MRNILLLILIGTIALIFSSIALADHEGIFSTQTRQVIRILNDDEMVVSKSNKDRDFTVAIIGGSALIFVLILVSSSVFTVEQQEVAIIQRLGKYHRLADPGLQFKIPFIDKIVHRVDMRVEPLDVKVETKTHDNVFVHMTVSIQYAVQPDKIYESYYMLTDDEQQITSYVFDVVRAEVPRMKLDEVFEKKDAIARAIKDQLDDTMIGFGYKIVKALVTDIEPDESVKASMNAINAAERNRAAAQEQGEANKILIIRQAEAEAESKILQGKGIAGMRKAIIDGLKESIKDFQDQGADPQDAIRMVLMNQYFDTLKELGMNGHHSTILIPHQPGAIGDIQNQILTAMVTSNGVKK